MGRGSKGGADPPLARATDLDGSEEERISFCEIEQEISFELAEGTRLSEGDHVRMGLSIGSIHVKAGGEIVGAVSPSQAERVKACIHAGYQMSGRVSWIDLAQRRAVAKVAGTRAE